MDRLLSGGNLINRDEVEIICSKLPDEVIDADMTSIRVLLERDAWYLLESAGKSMLYLIIKDSKRLNLMQISKFSNDSN